MAEKIDWKRTTDPHYPFTAEFEGKQCVIRLNNFPEEHLYTLIVNGKEGRGVKRKKLAHSD